jgi:gliding motility-associated-like protein
MDRSPNYILRFFCALLFTWSGLSSYAQNLVPNESFEINPQCPYQLTLICWDFAPPWDCATEGTCDLYHECAGGGIGVPNNLLGFQAAHSGAAYAGFLGTSTAPNRREYFIVPLVDTLEAGTWYDLLFYLSLPEESCGIEHIGAYFARTYEYVNNDDPLPFVPQIETDYGFLDDMVEWMPISGCYQAEGGEVFLIIGNFRDDDNTPLDPNCDSSFTYYYIDDVFLTVGEPPEPYELDMNGPVTECFSYEIVPEEPDLYYSWSDGSHEPTLVVTTSGEYTVTVSDGCDIGIGTIDVTILDSVPPIDLGPPDTILCNGEEFTIALDPDIGDVEWSDGSVEHEYTINTPGVYTVTVSNICNSSSDQVNVALIDPPAPIDLGDDVILCQGDAIHITFDPSLGNFEWQDNSTAPEYSITEGGTYAVTVSNMCGEVTDEMTVTSLNLPEIDLGDDLELCTGEEVYLGLDPEEGDYVWQDGSIDAQYSITDPGIYAVTVTNSCGSSVDQIQVLYYDAPVFNLGPDLILCPGDTITLDGDGINGLYQWQDNSSGNIFEVTAGGTYSLLLTTGCGSATDSIIIAYDTPVIPPDLGADFTLCPGETQLLHVSATGAEIVWQDGSTADSFLVTTSGTYFVTVKNSCDEYTDTIHVVINANPPQVDLPSSVLLCQGEVTVLEANVSGVNYIWSDASQDDSLLVSTPGIYSLTVSNACGTDADTVMVSDSGSPPGVFLGNDVALCPGDTILIHPQSTDVNTWLWQDGSMDSTYTVTTDAVVSVITMNECGAAYDTLLITLLDATPQFMLGNDTSLCSGEIVIVTISIPNVNIVWSDGSTGNQLIIDQPGTVHATISNACGQTSDTLVVDPLPSIPMLDLGIDQSLCPGETITLDPGIADVNYIWQNGSLLPSFNATQAGNIYLTISNACGSSSDTLIITESMDGPQVNLGADIIGCEGDEVILAADISGVDYVWQDGSTFSTYTATTSGIYYLDVSNSCGVDSDTITVNISGTAPSVDLGADTTVCEGTIVTLSTQPDSITNVIWQDGSDNATFVIHSAGTFSVVLSNHCGEIADTIHVMYAMAPDPFDLGPDTTICQGEWNVLTAPVTPYAIQWHDGSSGQEFVANASGTYSLQISNDCGTATDAIDVIVEQEAMHIELGPDTTLCIGEQLLLDATQAIIANYSWSTGESSPTITVTNPGTYAVTVITSCNEVTDEQIIGLNPNCNPTNTANAIYAPNVFSPNGDQINDVFTIGTTEGIEILSSEGFIFDRWGNVVFYDDAIPFTWDGKFDDKPVMPGVYVYSLTLRYRVNHLDFEERLVGDVTVVN